MNVLELSVACNNANGETRFVVNHVWQDERTHKDLVFDGVCVDMPLEVFAKRIKGFTVVSDKNMIVVSV